MADKDKLARLSLALEVRRLRLERDWRQEDLAALTGIGRGRISAIERAAVDASTDECERLARAFSIDADALRRGRAR